MGGRSEHGGDGDESHGDPRGYGPEGHAAPGGLSLAANGFRFEPTETRFEPGTATDWTFRIRDDDGVVTQFEEAHGERIHLVVVRRDLTRFQHRHPTVDGDGTCRVSDFSLPEPGAYRAFADFVADGRPATLGFDLFAPGSTAVEPRPDSSRRATAEGYAVELLADRIAAGERTRLAFEVRRDGERVSRLGEYLGALGHLVALREGDLAYLHVHPEATDPESGRVEFDARFPTPGRYRLFFQAKPDGVLVTTRFDVRIDG
ncbi:FixH family protein [Haladaptatus salinisoli]|uniref:FixH family protein n=1 Tax=Haladaptatus salinisoli TaxID=2884876 RepID=UPI001D0A605D|nr:FixH family protein [Haladaptatus salinisoli]